MELKNLNLKYALANVGFMVLVAGSLGFAFNYLSQSGFSTGTIGTVMSIVSLLGIFIGPAVGDLADRSEKITPQLFITGSMIVCAAAAVLLLLIPQGSMIILPVIVLAFASSTMGMPLLNGMAFSYEKAGGVINYGLCRGVGSAAYAIASSAVGNIWAMIGRNTLPFWMIFGAALTIVTINLMPKAPKVKAETEENAPAGEPISVLQFFSKYGKLIYVIGGMVFIYFCQQLMQTYMGALLPRFVPEDQIEAVQGNALFIQAMVELPTMFGFALIMKKLSVNQIIAIAATVFTIKHAVMLMANSVPMWYGAMVLQMFSYAAITPALVYYANDQTDEEDRNKGQAVFMTASTVGGLLASFVGGWVFQLLGVNAGLIVGVAASAIGTALVVFGCKLTAKPKEA